MPKKIILLLDGTSNEISKKRSNVLRLYGTLEKSDEQLVYYDPGVGTFGSDTAWSSVVRKTSEVWGMATGWGMDTNVREAYCFLVDNYEIDEHGQPDTIYIFGFSRGAYTARVLAGFLHAFGLVERRNLNLVEYAYRAYKAIGMESESEDFSELRLHERILQPHRPRVRLLGLFDTVSSVIESGRFFPRLRSHAFTAHNSSVEAVRQALSIHERRTMFRPQLWPTGQQYHPHRFSDREAVPQDTREVWFAGVHGSVGGGYPEPESALAKFPLYWMIRETETMGLAYKSGTVNRLVLGQSDDGNYSAPDVLGVQHNSMSLPWSLLEYIPRRTPAGSRRKSVGGVSIPRSDWRAIPDGALVHRSAIDRFAKQGETPPNLPDTPSIAEEHMPPAKA